MGRVLRASEELQGERAATRLSTRMLGEAYGDAPPRSRS
jgi:hypothetical protein